jgi:hypothetical protein
MYIVHYSLWRGSPDADSVVDVGDLQPGACVPVVGDELVGNAHVVLEAALGGCQIHREFFYSEASYFCKRQLILCFPLIRGNEKKGFVHLLYNTAYSA